MKVVICGAGQVGTSIARYLASEHNDVTVLDQSPELISHLNESLDVQAVVGYASHPEVLEQVGVKDADMLIAVTRSDEVNMVACQIAHSLFNVPTKIARIRHQSYLNPLWADLFTREHMPIDVIISPEIEVANAISRRLTVPGAFDMIPLADDKVRLIGVRCTDRCPIVHTPLRQLTSLFPDLNIIIVGIVRDDDASVPSPRDQMLPGDSVYFVANTEHVSRAMAAFGHEEQEARRIIILGGGNIGLSLAHLIEASKHDVSVKVIEYDAERARFAAESMPRTAIILGDCLDPEILAEANVSMTETVVAVTDDDETNILGSLLAKRYGAERAVTLINKTTYSPLITTLGIDVVVSPQAITVSTILQHVRRGRIRAVHSLGDGFAEVIEADALETSPLVGKPLKETKLPRGVIVGAVLHNDEVIIPSGETIINPDDRIIILAAADVVKKVEKLFSVRLEFF